MDISARVTSKGQVTIPKDVRQALGVNAGDHIVFRVTGEQATIARTPDLLELAGAVEVPAAKRGTSWDDVRKGRSPHSGVTMTAFVDTNVLIRHLTADPPDIGERATTFLAQADELFLVDLIAAETVYVLESYYDVDRSRVAELLRSIVAFQAIRVLDEPLLLRALEIYEVHRLDFADAYLVACAEVTGDGTVVRLLRSQHRPPYHRDQGRAVVADQPGI